MKSRTTARFRALLARLPEPIRRQAQRAHKVFSEDPSHRSLHFKRVHPTRPLYSARVSLGYRALGVRDGDDIVWYWIGTHTEYERLLKD